MTAALFVAVIILAILTLGNLLLLLGVLRRLRYVQELAVPEVPVPLVGTGVKPFATRAIDGTIIDAETLSNGTALVAIVTTSCPACQEMVHSLASLDLPAESTFVFIIPDADAPPDDAVAALSTVARIAIVDRNDDAIRAFGDIHGFPTVVVSRHGEVVASATHIEAVLPTVRKSFAEAIH